MTLDQADRLRDMVSNRAPVNMPDKLNSRIIAVSSGKGGVGKTNFTVNLAIYLQQQNKRVVVLDTDFGLANVEILFGVFPKYNLSDVLTNEKTITEILSDGPQGIKFVSAGSGIKEMANIEEKQVERLVNCITVLDSMFDVILIDTGAGASNAVVNFIKAATEAIIVTTPEPTAVTDAYSLIKTMCADRKEGETDWNGPELKLILNRVESHKEGDEIFEKLSRVTTRFLNVNLSYLGSLPDDSDLIKAVKKQQPVAVAFPNSRFCKSMQVIGGKLLNIPAAKQANTMSFVKRLLGVFGSKK